MMFRKIALACCLLPFLFLLPLLLPAQTEPESVNVLVLQKRGRQNTHVIPPGTRIKFRLKSEWRSLGGHLQEVRDSSFIVDGVEVPFSKLQFIQTVKPALEVAGLLFALGGIILFLFAVIHLMGPFRSRAGYIRTMLALVTAPFVSAAGFIAHIFSRRLFRFPDGWNVRAEKRTID